MWEAIFIILLVIEAVLTFFFVRSFINSKKANSETVGYFISILALGYIIYLIPFFYNQLVIHSNDNIIIGLLSCLLGAIKMFAFDYLTESMKQFIAIYPVYGVVFTIASILAMFTTVLASLTVFYVSFVNNKRLKEYLKNRNCDIVLGTSKIDIDFLNNRHEKIIWPSTILKKEEFAMLVDEGYAVINQKLDLQVLSSNLFRREFKYNFYHLTENEDEEIFLIKTFKALLKEKEQYNKILHLNMHPTKVEVFDKIIKNDDLNLVINVFSINKLIARDLVQQIPLTKYLNESYFNFGRSILNDNKYINVFIVGFDNINEELIKNLVYNNQLVHQDGLKYKAAPVRYFIIDPTCSEDNIQFARKIEILKNKICENSENYLGLFEDIAQFHLYKINPMSIEAMDIIKSYLSDVNSFNYFFVSLGNKYKNTIFADKLSDELTVIGNNFHLVCNCSKQDIINDLDNEKISYYGDYKEVLEKSKNYKNRFNSMINTYNFLFSGDYQLSNGVSSPMTPKKYESISGVLESFNHILSSLNFTLYDFKNEGYDNCKYEVVHYGYFRYSRFVRKLSEVKLLNEKLDVNFPTRELAMLHQQHLRWCARKLIDGYKPMTIDKYQEVKRSKDEILKENIYLTSFNNLDNVKEFLGNINNRDKDEYDVKIYDSIYLYHLDSIAMDGGYYICNLNRKIK